jgi:O-succinylbenzoic acid--CoA ligase
MVEVIRLLVPEAARAVLDAWERGRPVLVLDPRAPEPGVAADLARPVAEEVAAVVLTSGTAGEPRGVELTWDGLRASALAVSAALEADPRRDRWLCLLPLHHVAGLAVVARSWVTGVPLAFDGPATLTSMVPTLARRHDLARFRRVLVGGAAVPADLAALPNVVTTYGLTETWGGVVHDGHPLAGVEVALDPATGEILLRTPTVMRGYRHDPAATAAAFAPGGWLRTGDVGRFDGSGRLEVVDRLRDIVITGGVNVSPSEVERVLAGHPGVADVAVAGRSDPEWGERVVAYVVPADRSSPPTVEDLRAYGRDRLAPAKLPREVVVVEAVPRSPGGKVLKRLLPGAVTGSRPPASP